MPVSNFSIAALMGHIQGEEEQREVDTELKKESRIDENNPNEGIKITGSYINHSWPNRCNSLTLVLIGKLFSYLLLENIQNSKTIPYVKLQISAIQKSLYSNISISSILEFWEAFLRILMIF